MKITHLAHACFLIDNGIDTLLIDPYDDSIGYPHIKETVTTCLISHDHYDHNYIEDVTIVPGQDSFSIHTLDSFHDAVKGEQRGKNIIHIIESEGIKIVHLGDLGHILNDEQVKALQNIDILMIPIGGTFTIDSKQAIENILKIKPKNIIPMHYKTEETPLPLATPNQFLKEIQKVGYEVVKDIGNSIEYTNAMNKVYFI